jgi:hypothetical protein
MRTQLLSFVLAASAFFAPSANAQVQSMGGPDTGRQASWVIFAEMENGFTPHGAVTIQYGQPEWKDSYDAVLASGKFNGTTQRLGRNWWTSLDTTVAIEIGGTKIEAGSYYLAIQASKDGAMSLLVIDAKMSNQKGWLPFVASQWKSDIVCKLDLMKDAHEDVQQKMLISIAADKADVSKGTFSIRWGKHELRAAVAFHLPKPEAGKKQEEPKDAKK